MSSLFLAYFGPLPEQQRGVKRFWIESCGITPGRWGQMRYSLEDAICAGLFQFDQEGASWNFDLEEWVPLNPILLDEAWMEFDRQPRLSQIQIRNDDLLDYRNRLQSYGYIVDHSNSTPTNRRLEP